MRVTSYYHRTDEFRLEARKSKFHVSKLCYPIRKDDSRFCFVENARVHTYTHTHRDTQIIHIYTYTQTRTFVTNFFIIFITYYIILYFATFILFYHRPNRRCHRHRQSHVSLSFLYRLQTHACIQKSIRTYIHT